MVVVCHRNPDKIIGDYISLYFNIKESRPKLLYWNLPKIYVQIGPLYSFISKFLMVCKHLDFMSQEDVLELFDSFYNA